MYKQLQVATLTLALTGCAIKNFSPYVGTQRNWPTAPGGFVSTHKGFPIYKGLPDKPYVVLGELTIEQYPQYMNGEIASSGRKYQADAAMIVDRQTVNGGMMNFGGGGTTVYQGQSSLRPSGFGSYAGTQTGVATTYSNPSYSASLSWDKTTVYLIKFSP
jgi:hypothetical protein